MKFVSDVYFWFQPAATEVTPAPKRLKASAAAAVGIATGAANVGEGAPLGREGGSQDPSVAAALDKVRKCISQVDPSNSLLMYLLEELLDVAEKTRDAKIDFYRQLVQQAKLNQGKIKLHSFVAEVLGQGSDVISKALLKCLKIKKGLASSDDDDEGEKPKKKVKRPSSPLENLYQQPMGYMPQPFNFYGNYGGYRGYYRSRPFYRGAGRQFRQQGTSDLACFFCGQKDHLVKNCEKMKRAQQKQV